MFAPYEWMIARRYFKSSRRERFVSLISGFSLLGISLGVATLIIVMAVMNGYRSDLMNIILGLNGHAAAQGPTQVITDYQRLRREFEKIEGVVDVTPMIQSQVMVTALGTASGAIVRGISIDDLQRYSVVADNIVSGALEDMNDTDTVVLGSRLASRLRVVPGAKINVLSPEGTATPFGTVPRKKTYAVAAIFEMGLSEYDDAFLFMGLSAAQTYFKTGEGVHSFIINVTDPDEISDFVAPLMEVMGGQGRVVTWKQLNNAIATALQVEKNVMFMILTLIILVAAFNIISSLIMIVKDKASAIAILRTMGASQAAILRVFFIIGARIGVIGTISGVLLGTLFCAYIEDIQGWVEVLTGTEVFSAEVYYLTRLPAKMEWQEVTLVGAMTLFISFCATLYPAWRAAATDPVVALRYE